MALTKKGLLRKKGGSMGYRGRGIRTKFVFLHNLYAKIKTIPEVRGCPGGVIDIGLE